MFLPLFCVVALETSNCLMLAAGELMTAYHARCRERNAKHWSQFVLARAEAWRVYGAGTESHNDRTKNTQKHSTSSHNWWETCMKGSIFGAKPSIPALGGATGGGLVVAPAEKASLLSSQFYCKQRRDQFASPLSCFP